MDVLKWEVNQDGEILLQEIQVRLFAEHFLLNKKIKILSPFFSIQNGGQSIQGIALSSESCINKEVFNY